MTSQWSGRARAFAYSIIGAGLIAIFGLPAGAAPRPNAEPAPPIEPTVVSAAAGLWQLPTPTESGVPGPADSTPEPAAAESVPPVDPTPTPDWSAVVFRMDHASAAAGLRTQAPPAPPLALPEISVQSAPTAVPPVPTVVPVVPTAVPPVPTVVQSAPTAVPPVPTVVQSAPTAVPPAPPATASPYETRGRAALRRVGFDPAIVGYSISFHAPNSAFRGRTFTVQRHIEIYVRPSMSDGDLAYVVAHELGHAIDHIRNSQEDRSRWRSARGMAPAAAWWPTGPGSDLATPAGDFAECFASWAVGSPSHSTWGSCSGVSALVAELAVG